MAKIVEDYINEYLRLHLASKNELLEEMEQYAKINHVPIIEKEVARFLEVLIKIKKPKRILEIGTAIGYSSLIMKFAYPEAKITTIDINEKMYYTAQKNFKKAKVSDIHAICADALESLEYLEGPYDFIFLDAAKGHYKECFDYALNLLSKDGVILSDNILFRGMVAKDKYVQHRKITIVRRMREFIKYITNLESVSTSLIPIDDGMALTIKEEEYKDGKN